MADEITRGKWYEAALGLGGNLGDRRANIVAALCRLTQNPHIILTGLSPLRETKPYGVADQPDFLNAVCTIQTDLAPHELLAAVKAIERAMGRENSRRWGERNIDLDILLYSDLVMRADDLTIPHADLLNREFALEPLADVAGAWVHPVAGKTIAELWREFAGRRNGGAV